MKQMWTLVQRRKDGKWQIGLSADKPISQHRAFMKSLILNKREHQDFSAACTVVAVRRLSLADAKSDSASAKAARGEPSLLRQMKQAAQTFAARIAAQGGA